MKSDLAKNINTFDRSLIPELKDLSLCIAFGTEERNKSHVGHSMSLACYSFFV
jgi:vacuolar-type H+-ATPase subunit D/Vma8